MENSDSFRTCKSSAKEQSPLTGQRNRKWYIVF